MQVSGYLVFPDTVRDWEENAAWYASEGFDFELHVLLDSPLSELLIVAEDVMIEPLARRTDVENEA